MNIAVAIFILSTVISEVSEKHFYSAQKTSTQNIVNFLYHAGYYGRVLAGIVVLIALLVK